MEDEAAWLRARVRAGELERSKLELAAYCRHEPSLTSHLCEPRAWVRFLRGGCRTCRLKKPGRWFRGLGRWGEEVSWRATLAALWRYWDGPEERLFYLYPLKLSERALTTADAWLACPCETHWALHQETRSYLCGEHYQTAAAASAPHPPAPPPSLWEDGEATLASCLKPWLAAAIHDDLVPWALGYRDPVRERVEARQREAAGE